MTAPRRDAFATERAMAAIGRAALVGAVLIAVLDVSFPVHSAASCKELCGQKQIVRRDQ